MQTPSIICTLFPITQFSDIETLLPIITSFPILTSASILEKLPMLKLEPITDETEINELLIFFILVFLFFFCTKPIYQITEI